MFRGPRRPHHAPAADVPGADRTGGSLREEEIRPADLQARLREYMLRDRDRWLAGRPGWVKVPCPACGVAEGRAFEVRGYTFMECAGCATAWHNPRPGVAQLAAHGYLWLTSP